MSDPPAGAEQASLPSDLWSAASDKLLLLGTRRRDDDAFAALYDRYGSLVFTLALRIVGDRSIAEAVMQDVFLRCWHGLEQFDEDGGNCASWLLGVTRTRAIIALRGLQHEASRPERDPLPDDAPMEPVTADGAEEIASGEAAGQVLGELSEPQREAIQLAYFGGLTQAEVADRLGEPLGTVKAHVRDGLRHLRHILSQQPGGDQAGEAS